MLYSTLLVAVTAFSGLVAAQNITTTPPNGECCNVAANTIPSDKKSDWCRATENTCPEICGGQGQLANGGNDCNDDTLSYTCECKNGTEPDMSLYEQSVPGQMCRYWFDACINATGDNLSEQYICTTTRDEKCGNLTTRASSSSSASSRLPSATGGSGGSSSTSSGGQSSSTGGAAFNVAQFGTPVFAGSLVALFGLAL